MPLGARSKSVKKCYMRNRFGFTVDIYNTCKSFVYVNFSYLLDGDVIKYGFDSFYNCSGCTLNKNLSLNKHRFNSGQKYLPRGMVNIKQPTVSAVNKYFSSAGQHKQKNKKTTGQIKFSAVTIRH